MASTSTDNADIPHIPHIESNVPNNNITSPAASSETSTDHSTSTEPIAGPSNGPSLRSSPAGSSAGAESGDSGIGNNDGASTDSTYECTICLETAKDAVVSLCGHLFCWPCLHQWLETRPQRQMCPVCKAAISKDKVIPLYGRDNKNQQDPRTKEAPPRPAAQRTEPESSNFHGFGFPDGGGFHMSFGIGAFPLGFFTSSFNFGSEGVRPAHASEEDQFLSKLFLWVGILFLAWLLLA